MTAENDAPCDPPCSMACMVTGGVHHTDESLRAAALEELTKSMTEPIPSKCPGWYVAEGNGRGAGFTSDPQQAKQRPIQREEND